MATTSTAFTANDAVIKLDDENGTLVDISGSTNTVEITYSQGLGPYRVFGDRWVYRTENTREVSVSISAIYTSAEEEGVDLLKEWSGMIAGVGGGARTLDINIPDASAGSDNYNGEMKLAELSIPLDAGEDGPVMVDASLENHGAFVLTTIAS